MRYVGIDYSLTSPCVCIHSGETFDFNSCTFHFLTSVSKYEGKFGQNLFGHSHQEFSSDEQRYYNITNWVLNLLSNSDKIMIEGYSMGSTGRVFNIAENAGLLKHYLWLKGMDFTSVPPTVVKKFATGKGNANKEKIQESFINDTGVNIKDLLHMTEKQWNPSSDIIDSFYICKYGVENV